MGYYIFVIFFAFIALTLHAETQEYRQGRVVIKKNTPPKAQAKHQGKNEYKRHLKTTDSDYFPEHWFNFKPDWPLAHRDFILPMTENPFDPLSMYPQRYFDSCFERAEHQNRATTYKLYMDATAPTEKPKEQDQMHKTDGERPPMTYEQIRKSLEDCLLKGMALLTTTDLQKPSSCSCTVK